MDWNSDWSSGSERRLCRSSFLSSTVREWSEIFDSSDCRWRRERETRCYITCCSYINTVIFTGMGSND